MKCSSLFAFILSLGISVIMPVGCLDYANDTNLISFQQTQLTDHSSIVIGSNSDFEAQGLDGEGTEASPYLIESLRITDGYCIQIENTSLFFAIRDCELIYQNTTGVTALGIVIVNASHGSVERCNITGFENIYHSGTGISLHYTEDIDVVENKISDCDVSINLFYSNSSIFENNFVNSDYYSIRTMMPCSDIILRSNTFEKIYTAQSNALYLSGWNWTIENNDINGDYGSTFFISLFDSSIINNNFYSIDLVGYGCHSVNFSFNRFETSFVQMSRSRLLIINSNSLNSYMSGLKLILTSDSMVYNNSIFHYNDNILDNDGFNNTWDDGVSLGNRWSDYNGTGVYNIPGSSGSVDRYPLILQSTTSPITSSTTSPVSPPDAVPVQFDSTLIIVLCAASVIVVVLIVVMTKKRA